MFDKNVWLNSRNNLLLQLFLSSFRQRPKIIQLRVDDIVGNLLRIHRVQEVMVMIHDPVICPSGDSACGRWAQTALR